jgi:hypothetical protein
VIHPPKVMGSIPSECKQKIQKAVRAQLGLLTTGRLLPWPTGMNWIQNWFSTLRWSHSPLKLGVKREQFHCTKVTSTGMVRGVALNLSSSGNNDLALGQVLSEEGAFHWPPKTTILWVLALTLYKSIGRNVRLYASAKVRDTQYCKLGGQGLKKLLCPLGV